MTTPTDGYTLYNADGECIGKGTGRPQLQAGEYIVYSLDPESEQDTQALYEKLNTNDKWMNVEDWKTEQEYAGKADDAVRWLANNEPVIGDAPLVPVELASAAHIAAHTMGDHTAEHYPWMALEMDARGITARECAEMIIAAINRDDEHNLGALEKARRRINLREELRATEV